MERLADYVVILEHDENQIRHGNSIGVVKQKFPENDWDDVPFSPSLNIFCMPQGWQISHEQKQPTYFVGTLTDLMGAHQYACCLQFYEPLTESFEVDDSIIPSTAAFKPKVLVILTRFTFFEFFRMCLRRMRSSLTEDGYIAEHIAVTLLSTYPRTKSPYTICLGHERFMLGTTTQSKVPMTGTVVSDLVRYLGSLHNLVLLYRCILYDQKIVLHSKSMKRLSCTSYAIKAIVYPMEYTYPFVPLLPEQMLEYLESPTPYLMGILSDHIDKVGHVDAVFVDLDTGEIKIPSSIDLPNIPSPYLDRLVVRLQAVLSPELDTADFADTVALPPKAEPFILDKRIRACFLLFLAEVLYGYRSCLQLVRLRVNPLIVFHKAAFIGLRGLNSSFLHHMLQGQMFQLFVTHRGIPFRECDIFDELVCRNPQYGTTYESGTLCKPLMEVADVLIKNEQQEHFLPMSQYSKETGVMRNFEVEKLNLMLKKELDKQESYSIPATRKLVPSSVIEKPEDTSNNSRRIFVLTACIEAIFDNRLPEARKMMNAVELALKMVEARVFLCRQLSATAVPVTRATLNPQQFELIVRLLNCSLEQESDEDEHGVAYACLHLGNLYCRRLTQGVHQYAYTCIQDHPVWSNARFWEAAFFHDVHELMRHSYGQVSAPEYPLGGDSRFDMWNMCDKPTGMDVAADLMQTEHELNEKQLQEFQDEEDAIVYGQAKHYINLMVCLKIPLDPSRLRRIDKNDLELRGNALGQKDLRERMDKSDDSDIESGYGDTYTDGDIGATVVTWITGLVDRLCCAARLDSSKIDRLIRDIPGFVAVHIDSLEQVYAESRKIVPPPKTKLLVPVMLTPSEKIIMGGLRCVLLIDERNPPENPENNRYPLPAEGAVYLTNYRVVFKGQPINPYLSDVTVIRSMPIMSVVKEKSISDGYLHTTSFMELIPSKIANGLHDAIQIRSSCFVLMNIAFDEDVTPDQAEEFSKSLTSLRWPATLPTTLYAFAPVSHLLTHTLPINQKNKMSTIRDLKKTISKQLPAALMKRHDPRNMSPMKALTQPRQNSTLTNEADYLDLGGDSSTLVAEVRHYLSDYERLRLKREESMFRLSYANTYYDVVKSYPSCFIVPCSSSDATFAKVSKGFKNGRLPVITWISENGALLIRGAGFVTGNVLNKIKKANLLHPTESASNSTSSQLTLNSRDTLDAPHSTTHSSLELQEAYISKLAQASPSNGPHNLTSWNSQASSLISLDSLLTGDASEYGNTPDLNRKSTNSDLMKTGSTFIRASAGKAGNKNKVPSVVQKQLLATEKHISQRSLQAMLSSLNRKSLYVLVDKGQHKNLRVDKYTAMVPVTYPSTGDMKAAFKKLLRAMQPGGLESEAPFYKSLEDSGWRNIIAHVLSLAGSISSIIATVNSSVALCLEDGYDVTCVLMSLVQIMQDPFYRTFDGFRVLIEKEWLAFGYRFSHRANHTLSSQSRGIAPVFLIFLDAVHQILDQYPDAFEYDDYYLRFIAYHSQSAFFRTFIFDSEYERIRMERVAADGPDSCIWSYIKHQCESITLFNNLRYCKVDSPLVPACSESSFDNWIFYDEENFIHGPCYDIEICQAETAEIEERRLANSEGLTRSEEAAEIIDVKQTSTRIRYPNGLELLTQENPLDGKAQTGWQNVWKKAVLDEPEQDREAVVDERISFEKHIDHLIQKRSGLKLILKGEYARTSKTQTTAKAHSFESYTATGTQPHDCNLCHFALYGNVVKAGQKCKNCGVIAHDKCVLNITWPCGLSSEAREKALQEARSVREQTGEKTLRAEVSSPEADISMESRTLTVGRGRPIALHQGYLKKRGTKFKMWTPRWFVLEAHTHKLAYYENEMDATCRGYIDLCDLESVDVILTGSKAILELRTASRIMSLLADGGRMDAYAWKDKIEQALHE